jgi:hypothetical protein
VPSISNTIIQGEKKVMKKFINDPFDVVDEMLEGPSMSIGNM